MEYATLHMIQTGIQCLPVILYIVVMGALIINLKRFRS